MTRTLTHVVVLTFIVLCVFQALASEPLEASTSRLRFSGGSATMDGLIGELLVQLESQDEKGLRALRVTEREYRELVVPGNVAKGEQPQILSGEASEYFWQVMDQKSRHFEKLLLQRFGDTPFTVKDVSFEKGHKEYAGHQAWRRLSLVVTDEGGQDRLIRTGSIIERDGRYKFVSFIRD